MKRSEKNNLAGIDTYTEGMRYISNAAEILNTKAKLSGDRYTDKKYVKMAGHTAYTGILHALDCMKLFTIKKGSRPDVKDYQSALATRNKKMLDHFLECYEVLHLMAGYDGYGHRKHLKIAFSSAESIIKWAANNAA